MQLGNISKMSSIQAFVHLPAVTRASLTLDRSYLRAASDWYSL